MAENYEYKVPSRVTGWVLLILTTIIDLFSVYFWLPIWRLSQELNHDVGAAISQKKTTFVIYIALSILSSIMSTLASIAFARAKKYYGQGFDIFLGRFFLFLGYAAFAVSIIAMYVF